MSGEPTQRCRSTLAHFQVGAGPPGPIPATNCRVPLDHPALVEDTTCCVRSAKRRSKTDGAPSKVAALSGSAQPSLASVLQTQAFSPSAWNGGPAPTLPQWAGPSAGHRMLGNLPWSGRPTAQPVVMPYQQAVAALTSCQGGAAGGTAAGMGLQTAQQSAPQGGCKGLAALPSLPGPGTAGLTGGKQGGVYQPGLAGIIGSNLAVIQPGCHGFRGFLCKRCAQRATASLNAQSAMPRYCGSRAQVLMIKG